MSDALGNAMPGIRSPVKLPLLGTRSPSNLRLPAIQLTRSPEHERTMKELETFESRLTRMPSKGHASLPSLRLAPTLAPSRAPFVPLHHGLRKWTPLVADPYASKAGGAARVMVVPKELETALCRSGTADAKQAFLAHEWGPFYKELQEALSATRTRHMVGVSVEEVMPPQVQWEAWATRCRELTAKWYGAPNISAVYQLLIECSEYDGVSPYRFYDVPAQWSDDGWVRALDGNVRASFGKKARELKKGQAQTLAQTAGESAIDNTILPNILTREESAVLLAGQRIKALLVGQMARRQRKMLAALKKMCPESLKKLPAPLAATEEELKSALQLVRQHELERAGVNEHSSAWQRLRDAGKIISSFGQLTLERRVQVEEFLRQTMADLHAANRARDGEFDELHEFVSFIRASPGRLYKGDRKKHERMMLSVMLSPKYTIVKRSTIEQFTNHRFLVNCWTRRCDLVGIDDDGTQTTSRSAGAAEVGRFRKNGFCYFESHGLGLTSSGLSEQRGTIAFELGVAKVADESAKLGNWFLNDFEKILVEAEVLNAAGALAHRLPGEASHEVSQNPKASSSIAATQHTQISRGGIEMWPVLRLVARPTYVAALDAYIDLVQIGDQSDAIALTLVTWRPSAPPIRSALVGLRRYICKKLGGRAVDFSLIASPRGDGTFLLHFTPVAALEWLDRSTSQALKEGSTFRNNSTGEFHDSTVLPCATVDSSQAKGNMLTYDKAAVSLAMKGEPIVRALYDYNRLVGARQAVVHYVRTRLGVDLELSTPAGRTSTVAPPPFPKAVKFMDVFADEES